MRIEFLSNGQPNHSNWSIRTSFTEQKRCLAGLTFRHFFEGFCSEIFRCTENCPILALGYGMRNPNPPGLSCWGIRVKGFSNGIPKGPKANGFMSVVHQVTRQHPGEFAFQKTNSSKTKSGWNNYQQKKRLEASWIQVSQPHVPSLPSSRTLLSPGESIPSCDKGWQLEISGSNGSNAKDWPWQPLGPRVAKNPHEKSHHQLSVQGMSGQSKMCPVFFWFTNIH